MASQAEIVLDPAAETTKEILDRLFPPPRFFGVRLWDGMELPSRPDPPFSIVLNFPGSLRRMLAPPLELSFGEGYIYGDFNIEGDIYGIFGLLDALVAQNFTPAEIAGLFNLVQQLPRSELQQVQARGPAELHGPVHSRKRDREAIRFHYDVGNDFFGLWLDPQMQYSCGYFPTGRESLAEAQTKKIEYICRKLRLQPGERLLDIGCGWGGLARAAARRFGVSVLGVTLSPRQAEYAAEQNARLRLGDRVRVELRDYRDLGAESFDKIVSVGMFEHVGRTHLPEYFAKVHRLLKPGGLFLNHGISRRGRAADLALLRGLPGPDRKGARLGNYFERRILGSGTFSQRYVFPDGELVPVSEADLVAEAAGFEVRDVEDLREHYALTLRSWVRRLEEQRTEAVCLAGEEVFRTWQLYLSSSALQFEAARIGIHQSLLAKPAGGKAGLPLSRADIYAPD
jgi:cyclopropane-fatty-acyl-phospholipid synthase